MRLIFIEQYFNVGATILLLSLAMICGCLEGSSTTSCVCDDTPPVVGISSPQDGALVSGIVPVMIEANDANGVDRVLLFVDGVSHAVISESPYIAEWNTGIYSETMNPQHVLFAKGIDVHGNVASSDDITVMVCSYDIEDFDGILETDESGVVIGGDEGDWCPVSVSGPAEVGLFPAFPNPATVTVTIRWSVPTASHVSIKLIDSNCILVRTLVDGIMSAGLHSVTWDTMDETAQLVSPGIYRCVMNSGDVSCYGDIQLQ